MFIIYGFLWASEVHESRVTFLYSIIIIIIIGLGFKDVKNKWRRKYGIFFHEVTQFLGREIVNDFAVGVIGISWELILTGIQVFNYVKHKIL